MRRTLITVALFLIALSAFAHDFDKLATDTMAVLRLDSERRAR